MNKETEKVIIPNLEILEPKIIPSVQVVFMRQGDQDTEVFLVHRISGSFLNQWSFPGGQIDPGETPTQTACREIQEETGVEIQETDLQFLRATTSETDRQINNVLVPLKYSIQVFTVSTHNLFPFNTSPQEHDQAAWFSLDRIPNHVAPKTLETIKILANK